MEWVRKNRINVHHPSRIRSHYQPSSYYVSRLTNLEFDTSCRLCRGENPDTARTPQKCLRCLPADAMHQCRRIINPLAGQTFLPDPAARGNGRCVKGPLLPCFVHVLVSMDMCRRFGLLQQGQNVGENTHETCTHTGARLLSPTRADMAKSCVLTMLESQKKDKHARAEYDHAHFRTKFGSRFLYRCSSAGESTLHDPSKGIWICVFLPPLSTYLVRHPYSCRRP